MAKLETEVLFFALKIPKSEANPNCTGGEMRIKQTLTCRFACQEVTVSGTQEASKYQGVFEKLKRRDLETLSPPWNPTMQIIT